ncbi:MAG: hypothetical protein LBU65_04580 [Planctomycetaceae bacterium]|jgi:hypothetical protein|nr:hypothetical protein [Planctomycetaceae bacterium]
MNTKLFSSSLVVTLLLGGSAYCQIPEQPAFNPSSYGNGGAPGISTTRPAPAHQYVPVIQPVPQPMMSINADGQKSVVTEQNTGTNEDNANGFGDKWKELFPVAAEMEQQATRAVVPVVVESVQPIPYLAYHTTRDGRTHIVPYAPAYQFAPEQLPRRQGVWKRFWSSHPSSRQDTPQVNYLSYYDPMPTVIENEPQFWKRALGYPKPQWGPVPAAQWAGALPAARLGRLAERFYQGNWYEDYLNQQNAERVAKEQEYQKLINSEPPLYKTEAVGEDGSKIAPEPPIDVPVKRSLEIPVFPTPDSPKIIIDEEPTETETTDDFEM